MDDKAEVKLADLIHHQRWACLATVNNGKPYASFVAFVPETDFSAMLIHISQLAPHTQYLLLDPRAAFAISEQDQGDTDPQTLVRLSMQGRVETLERDTKAYQQARARYLERLPDAERLFSFTDFILFRFLPVQIRFVAGFARTWNINPERMQAIAHAYYAGGE